jgi:tRNA(Ile)-lysidine synthase
MNISNLAQTEIEKHLKKNDRIILGLSGGPDSIFLLHQLLKIQDKLSLTIVVAHLNHKIRAQESDTDQAFVTSHIKKHQNNNPALILEVQEKNIPALTKTSKENLEAVARKHRYHFFKLLAKKHSCRLVLTAHHADDNIETILLNLTRGTGLQGLTGIETITPYPVKPSTLKLFRPLLKLEKKEIIHYLEHHKIPYCTDSSNFDEQYNRNLLRHQVIPKLKSINPNITKTITQNLDIIKGINDFLNQLSDNWIQENYQKTPEMSFPRSSFIKLHKAIQSTILIKIHEKVIGNTSNLQYVNTLEVIQLIDNNIGNKQKRFGKITFYLRNNIVKITKNSENEARK